MAICRAQFLAHACLQHHQPAQVHGAVAHLRVEGKAADHHAGHLPFGMFFTKGGVEGGERGLDLRCPIIVNDVDTGVVTGIPLGANAFKRISAPCSL
jgi:hypothetical protein